MPLWANRKLGAGNAMCRFPENMDIYSFPLSAKKSAVLFLPLLNK